MELSTTTLNGSTVNVIFTGSNYFFYNSYFGLVAVAERTTQPTEEVETFRVTVGNRHCVGGSFNDSAVYTLVKRVVNKSENKYITKRVRYSSVVEDLADHRLKIELV